MVGINPPSRIPLQSKKEFNYLFRAVLSIISRRRWLVLAYRLISAQTMLYLKLPMMLELILEIHPGSLSLFQALISNLKSLITGPKSQNFLTRPGGGSDPLSKQKACLPSHSEFCAESSLGLYQKYYESSPFAEKNEREAQ